MGKCVQPIDGTKRPKNPINTSILATLAIYTLCFRRRQTITARPTAPAPIRTQVAGSGAAAGASAAGSAATPGAKAEAPAPTVRLVPVGKAPVLPTSSESECSERPEGAVIARHFLIPLLDRQVASGHHDGEEGGNDRQSDDHLAGEGQHGSRPNRRDQNLHRMFHKNAFFILTRATVIIPQPVSKSRVLPLIHENFCWGGCLSRSRPRALVVPPGHQVLTVGGNRHGSETGTGSEPSSD